MNIDIDKEKLSDFETSIDSFCPDITISPPENNKKKSHLSLPRILIMLICASVFVYCIYSLIEIYKSNLESASLYDDIYSDFADLLGPTFAQAQSLPPTQSSSLSSSASTPSKGGNFNTIVSGTTSQKFQQALSKLEKLNAQNPDIVGYISITGTSINYPILQCEDNDFYLTHASDKMLSKAGSIFYDWRNSSTPDQNKNIVVYGHNMSNGTMFHNLRYFLDNEQLFNEGQIIIYSFDGIYTYDIFSIYYADAYDNYLRISFTGSEDYTSWLNERATLSLFKTNVNFDADSHIISLSTCLNGTSDGRIAVHGVLTNVER